MNYLRNRAGIIIVAVIGLAIVAFLVSDAIRLGSPFWSASRNQVGEVAGETISFNEFSDKVDQATNAFKMQMRKNSVDPSMMGYVVDNAWNQTVSEIILKKQFEKVGLNVGEDELFDMIQGKNPNPQILRYFSDPATGQFDRAKLIQFLKNMDSDASGKSKNQWIALENGILEERLAGKYDALVRNSLYVTDVDLKDRQIYQQKLVNFKYVNLDYSSVSNVKLTEDDYESFYQEHKYMFKHPKETRSLDYVVFDASPTRTDSLAVRQQIEKLLIGFRNSSNDSLFVGLNADTKLPIKYLKKGELDPVLDSVFFTKSKGFIYGPYLSNGAYKIAKLLDARISPDSVKARHILIDVNAAGGLDKAKIKADSIKGLLQLGYPFASLAKRFSADPGSKDKGGSLGTFARNMMVPVFEEACFNGKKGDLKVVTSNYGVHLIEIMDQMGASKVVKVGVIDKAIAPSAETQRKAYSDATSFLSVVNNAQTFDDKAKQMKYVVRTAEDIASDHSYVIGIENSRELVRWAFKADIGEVSTDILELGNKYVIARLKNVEEEGYRSLSSVKKEIEYEVRNVAKAKILVKKLEDALASSNIEQVAQKLGKSVEIAQNILMSNPIIPGVAREDKLIGSVFGSKMGKMSKAIVGDKGVYAFVLYSFANPPELTDKKILKQNLVQQQATKAVDNVMEALKYVANVKDYRIKFY